MKSETVATRDVETFPTTSPSVSALASLLRIIIQSIQDKPMKQLKWITIWCSVLRNAYSDVCARVHFIFNWTIKIRFVDIRNASIYCCFGACVSMYSSILAQRCVHAIEFIHQITVIDRQTECTHTHTFIEMQTFNTQREVDGGREGGRDVGREWVNTYVCR